MQVDYCTEAKLFDEKVDISTCKAMSDLKAGIPSDTMAETFIKIGMKCAQRIYKKRCTMSTVSIFNSIIVEKLLTLI